MMTVEGSRSHPNLLLKIMKKRPQRQQIRPIPSSSSGASTVPPSKRSSWSGQLRALRHSASTSSAPALSGCNKKHRLANDIWEVDPRRQKDRISELSAVASECAVGVHFSRLKSPAKCASSLHRKKNQSISFSRVPDALIQGHSKTPADLENTWSDTDIPRILKNQANICKTKGMSVSYPADSAQTLHRQRKTCMTRIELVDMNNALTQNRRLHMRMVLAEQHRQRQAGKVDAEELSKVSAKYSARNIEIANSSWWLERFKYR
mmetsp:Transcript_26673/g.63262  ORF Transcript_26673/g.63262 Transcript_26673/m.63262 type:complete len:263 (+) Transcript_26673:162-950(+)